MFFKVLIKKTKAYFLKFYRDFLEYFMMHHTPLVAIGKI